MMTLAELQRAVRAALVESLGDAANRVSVCCEASAWEHSRGDHLDPVVTFHISAVYETAPEQRKCASVRADTTDEALRRFQEQKIHFIAEDVRRAEPTKTEIDDALAATECVTPAECAALGGVL